MGQTSFPPSAILTNGVPTSEPVAAGVWWLNSGALTLSQGIAPTIDTQPQAASINDGETATFTVVSTNATSYQWQVDTGSGFENIEDTDSASYTTPVQALANDGDEFRCVITGPGGSTTTNAVAITVAAFSPSDLAPDFWLRAESETDTYSNNDPVTQWDDISGNTRHMTEATNPPTFKTAVNNSKAAIYFDGTNDRLVQDYDGSGTSFTLAGIMSVDDFGSLQVFWSDSSSYYFAVLATSGQLRIQVGTRFDTDDISFRNWWPILIRGNGTAVELYEGKNRIGEGTLTANPLRTEGVSNRPTFFWKGHMQEYVAKNAALSDSDASELMSYMLTEAGKSDAMLVVCDGDSLTSGLRSTAGNDYPAQMQALYGETATRTLNFGASGQTVVQMQSDAATQIDRFGKRLDGAGPVCVVWGGTNDINGGADSATTITNFTNYCTSRQSAGFRVMACTMIARGGFDATKETYRTEFNASVRANWATYADVLCDLAGDSRLSDTNDTTYFDADKVHLNDTGYGVVAALVKSTLDGIL
jgi:lysophospholipase L1-like esterase